VTGAASTDAGVARVLENGDTSDPALDGEGLTKSSTVGP